MPKERQISSMSSKTINFVTELFAKRQLPYIYSDVYNAVSQQHIFENTAEPTDIKDILIVEDLPRYLKIQRKEKPKHLRSFLIKQYPGFRIDFKDVKSLADYLNLRFGKSSRYKLKREQRKLERCFDIRYEMYFGGMSQEDYDFVFHEFYELLEVRSIEKGIMRNANLAYKQEYYERVHQMVLDKKASFFVIYNGKKPIDICLNFHVKNTIFQYIRTYDIAYSKFNTGYTDLMKQIEWCIANKIDSISFSKGPFYWKQRWCNAVYDYDYEVFYNARSIKSILGAAKFRCIKGIKQVVRELGIIERYHDFQEKRRKAKLPEPSFNIEIFDTTEDQFVGSKLERIDIYTQAYDELRRLIFDFLYTTDEKEKDISVFKTQDNSQTFFVKGKIKSGKFII